MPVTKDSGGGADAQGSVFQLYQPGLAPDQVLQLLLPPAVDVPLEQLIGTASPLSQPSKSSAGPNSASGSASSDQVKESARKHLLQPRAAAVEAVRRWVTLSGPEWLHIYESLQQAKLLPGQDDDTTGLRPARVPAVADVCWLLEQCPSDAFVGFVWDRLLISLLQQCVSSGHSSCQRLLQLIVSHRSFASLRPKDFRAKVRARIRKPSPFATYNFARPTPAKDLLKKRTGGFGFMKFQSKPGDAKQTSAGSSGKPPPVFAAKKPLLGKLSVKGLSKKSSAPAEEAAASSSKKPILAKDSLPISFRAETKSSAAKKRKTTEPSAHEDKTNAFPYKSLRTECIGGLSLKNSGYNSKELTTGKKPQSIGMAIEKLQRGSIRSSFSYAAKPGVMANDRAVSKKRGLALNATETGSLPKRSKHDSTQAGACYPTLIKLY
ncbi:unnamed protein product [Phytophthora fragariaefolia]|uniref:Unnamed protein product n=1 Tax=Phytophthora fragariaefolia TaxID=1490495 RepID=A0A9W6X3S1_9STRA|nr:unnamed protein product [Phytophthora fragariaefolia]